MAVFESHGRRDAMKAWRPVVECVALVGLWGATAMAVAPAYESDEELSAYPIIVEARWDKAAIRPHSLVEGNVCKQYEVFTKITVIRVIKGDIKPGEATILMGYGIGWLKDGTGLGTYTSTEIFGDVWDVTEPALWFLDRGRSWDEADKTVYYQVPHYRAIQPAVLEEYFTALGSGAPEKAVAKLLSSDNPVVLKRVLRYACGGILPWPYDGDFLDMYVNPKERGKVLREQAEAVKGVIGRDVGEVRVMAASVYAELKGKDCVGFMRTLLEDKDPGVRGVAVGVLARQRDEESIGSMGRAVEGIEEGRIACKVIKAMDKWKEPRLAPALIPFLENDTFAYMNGDDYGIPAIKARQALHESTGCWFPYDVEVSAKAWRRVAGVGDAKKRTRMLTRLVPGGEFPVRAEFIGGPRPDTAKGKGERGMRSSFETTDGGEGAERSDVIATIRVKNQSGCRVTITRRPSMMNMSWPSGMSYGSIGPKAEELSEKDFVTLRPAETMTFEVRLHGTSMAADPKDRAVTLVYMSNGRKLGLKGWMGVVKAEFGKGWKEERKIEAVKETWPNGNLKAKGQTVNGQRFGEWEYFNENGDRIKIVHYTGGQGEATLDPESPQNKGAGRKAD